MTIQPVETGTSLDLELLVGELPAVPCEVTGHANGKYGHDNGAATHYIQATCPGCCHDNGVLAACAAYVAAARDTKAWCGSCRTWQDSKVMVAILGPVNSFG